MSIERIEYVCTECETINDEENIYCCNCGDTESFQNYILEAFKELGKEFAQMKVDMRKRHNKLRLI